MKRRTVSELLEGARARLDRLSPEEAYAAACEGAVLIDTRCEDDRRLNGIVPSSLHIPLSVLEWRVDPDSETRDPDLQGSPDQLILFCAHGYSSSLAAVRLLDLGISATDVIGGFEAWFRAGLPVERRGDLR
jgi:rhodanese-related sulfurtransferase